MSNVLHNVEVKWVYADKVDDFGKLNVTVVLSDEQAAEMEALGLKVKEKDGRKEFSFRKNPETRKGDPNTMPFFDRFGDEFDGHIPNGTRCDVSYRTFEWAFAGKKGIGAFFEEAKLLDDLMPGTSGLVYDKRPVMADDSPF